MRMSHAAVLAATLTVGLLASIPCASATATSFTYVSSSRADASHCHLSQDLLLGNDHHNYQQGHAWSDNGDTCRYVQYQHYNNGNSENQWNGRTSSSTSLWSPVTYDGPGYTVEGCVIDETVDLYTGKCSDSH